MSDVQEDPNAPATRADVAAVRADVAAVRADVAAVRGDVERVDAKIDGVEQRLDAKIDDNQRKMFEFVAKVVDKAVDTMTNRMSATVSASEGRLMAELGRHTKGSEEELTARVGAIDDKYADLPDRVTRLEAKVFPDD